MISEKNIETTEAEDKKFAVLDSIRRELEAREKYAEFFENPDHIAKVEAVKLIVKKFFRINNGMYVNSRPNRGKPVTVVKIASPVFPNGLSKADKENSYYAPLAEMGVDIRYAKGTNSWLYRVA
jgi:hypothetical protein